MIETPLPTPDPPADPARSYWYHRPDADFPPQVTDWPEGHDGAARLKIGGTPGGRSAREQREWVARWCEALPRLGSVRTLWVTTKTSQALFEAACAMPALDGLSLKSSAITSLEPLRAATSLRHLRVGPTPGLRDLRMFASMPSLRWLELEMWSAVDDLAALAELTTLEGLGVVGPDSGHQSVTSFAPLSGLHLLRWLHLGAMRPRDGTVLPLAGLTALRWLGVGRYFPWQEFAALARALPDTRCTWFKAGSQGFVRCRQCGSATITPSGFGLKSLCPVCDAATWAAFAAAFEAGL